MASASAYLAEAYVMRKLHKEKMKKNCIEDQKIEATTGDRRREVMNSPRDQTEATTSDHGRGCFFGMFKKIHPTPDALSPVFIR
ncbi:hypothetical protein Vadar_003145 [Vaccinium darrowii]|uniref:Uncharacterized protein n=1 Tax=Vaccinium darrowii TaxID=229202 RepID=A0ACB7XWF0_9ERIC|nr:hypothetical protein Vadar_003145 [Vaccinium darrowii]